VKPQDLTPKEIVAELDRYVIGQGKAKRAVAIALRNRWRRQKVSPDLKDEILPKNIIMIGPTGVGKTEIARRLARLAGAPFVKVEASKFTEVGYVGRDVDSMIRDLVEASVKLVKEEELEKLRERARDAAEERVLDALGYGGSLGLGFRSVLGRAQGQQDEAAAGAGGPSGGGTRAGRDRARAQLQAGTLDDEIVEVELTEKPPAAMPFLAPGMEDMAQGLQDMMQSIGNNPILSMLGGGPKKRKRKVKVKEALELLAQEEAARMVDMERVVREALDRAQNAGIVFIDEIDKIAGRDAGHGPDVSRGGVQRDLLPIVEGSNVNTKYGAVKTEHMLFIAAGAFHVAKVADLIPELQGRFPIRVELEPLSRQDLVRILTEPRSSLVRQYTALLATEGVDVQFREDAVEEVARIAAEVNERMENIGARRLHTVMERLLDEVSFEASEQRGQRILVDAAYVKERLEGVAQDEDLSRYIL
jgi:ATP-dependent HslUV protease ATP-binding subunit HslU